jgi:glycosyltransferase involved in cell wall biosynthesis
VSSLLVTNDFPPKVGGIQSYLWELWRRLPADEITVLTTPYDGTAEFDRAQSFRVVRDRDRVLLPHPALAGRIDALARDVHADVIFLDPALPLGALGPRLRAAPYVAVLHGAEVTVPGRLPGSRALLKRVLDGAAGVLAAGTYPAGAAARGVPAVAGDSGGAWEAVDDGSTGFVVDPLDAGAVAAALERLLADPALRRRMGEAARARAEQAFSYDALADRLVPLARGDLSVLTPVGGPRPVPQP